MIKKVHDDGGDKFIVFFVLFIECFLKCIRLLLLVVEDVIAHSFIGLLSTVGLDLF